MPNKINEVKAKLKVLADLLHRGWEKRYAVTEEERSAIRRKVHQQWERKVKKKGQSRSVRRPNSRARVLRRQSIKLLSGMS